MRRWRFKEVEKMEYLWKSLTPFGQSVVSALGLLIIAALCLGWLYES